MNRKEIDKEIEDLRSLAFKHDDQLEQLNSEVEELRENGSLARHLKIYQMYDEIKKERDPDNRLNVLYHHVKALQEDLENQPRKFTMGMIFGAGIAIATSFIIAALNTPSPDITNQTPETGFSGFGALSF